MECNGRVFYLRRRSTCAIDVQLGRQAGGRLQRLLVDRKRPVAIGGGSWRREGDPELLRSELRCSDEDLGFLGRLWSFLAQFELVALWFSLGGSLGWWRFGEGDGEV